MEKLSEMSLRQKIAQMLIIRGNIFDKRFVELGVGGIFFSRQDKSEEEYKYTIKKYQNNTSIKLFVAADMEGYLNPFQRFYETIPFGNIINKEGAYNLGKEHGRIMKKIGFNINFSPVVEVRNTVWPGRSFRGSLEQVKDKIKYYIKGLQDEGVIATAKHYPGGSMIKDPHKIKYNTEIYKEDLDLFDEAIQVGVKAVMIGHPIVYGAINSKGKQCTVSPEVISILRKKFNGLIITDAIAMMGLRWSYLFNFKRIYVDLIKAGNNLILDLDFEYDKIMKRIYEVEKAVKKGDIDEQKIDNSVRKILITKGYEIQQN